MISLEKFEPGKVQRKERRKVLSITILVVHGKINYIAKNK